MRIMNIPKGVTVSPSVAEALAANGYVAKKRSKYGASPTVYAGVRYASKAESIRAQFLDLCVLDGSVLWWIGQPVFRLGVPENKYVPDFLVVEADCSEVAGVHVEDVKGPCETEKFRRDRKLWAAYGPCELWIIKGGETEIVEGKS